MLRKYATVVKNEYKEWQIDKGSVSPTLDKDTKHKGAYYGDKELKGISFRGTKIA